MFAKHILLLGAALSICSSMATASGKAAIPSPNTTSQTVESSFKYQLYTTNVLPWTLGEKKGEVRGGEGPMAQALRNLLSSAQSHVEMALYGIQDQSWAFATLKQLIARGVQVLTVIDQKSGTVGDWTPKNFTYPDTAQLSDILPGDQIVPDQSANGKIRTSSIMHNKFFIVDDRFVWTGSSNISHTCMGSEYNANISLLIESPALSALYQKEFQAMHQLKLFSKMKGSDGPKSLQFGDGTSVDVFFAPEDDTVREGIVPFIESTEKSLDIGMFYLTNDDVIEALANAASRGVKVRLIYDAVAASHPSSHHEYLRQAGVEVRVENWGGKMHMKTAISDHQHVFTGSMNWTDAGDSSNDENSLWIRNHTKLAGELTRYFDSLWNSLSKSTKGRDPRAEGPQSINSCFDGIDNDHDGLIDAEEAVCKSTVQQD